MARSKRKARRGLPSPRSVVAEMPLIPGGTRPGRLAAAPGAAPTYRILRTTEVDPYDTPVPALSIPAIGAPAAAPAPPSDSFKGKARKATKLSIVAGAPDTFDDLKKLISDLPPDKDMVKHKPPITTKPTSRRAAGEKRNVRVRAFLYAASREADNDFHLIIGRSPSKSPSMYMTVELSGLPSKSSTHFKRLKKTRESYKTFFADQMPGLTYDFYDPPIPVEVEGSLFFDMSHATGSKPGPSSLRDDIPTIWEIHPISKIVFEP
jgi:hypothetical protein